MLTGAKFTYWIERKDNPLLNRETFSLVTKAIHETDQGATFQVENVDYLFPKDTDEAPISVEIDVKLGEKHDPLSIIEGFLQRAVNEGLDKVFMGREFLWDGELYYIEGKLYPPETNLFLVVSRINRLRQIRLTREQLVKIIVESRIREAIDNTCKIALERLADYRERNAESSAVGGPTMEINVIQEPSEPEIEACDGNRSAARRACKP